MLSVLNSLALDEGAEGSKSIYLLLGYSMQKGRDAIRPSTIFLVGVGDIAPIRAKSGFWVESCREKKPKTLDITTYFSAFRKITANKQIYSISVVLIFY